MSVQPFMPVVGDVSILPAKPDSNESETYKVKIVVTKNCCDFHVYEWHTFVIISF